MIAGEYYRCRLCRREPPNSLLLLCLISRTVALAECVGQELMRGNPWQDAPRCHVTNVATAGFLLSCKKCKWRGAHIHMGCHSPTDARMSWYSTDS